MSNINRRVFSLNFHLLCLIFQNVAATGCHSLAKFNNNYFNARLEGFVLYNVSVPGIADCARACFQQTNCLSFNFAWGIGFCELNSVNSSTNIELHLIGDNSFNFVNLYSWHESIAGSCGLKPCNGQQLCLPTVDKHTCIETDCLEETPTIIKATAEPGSSALGVIRKYVCTDPDVIATGITNTTCQRHKGTSTWSPVDVQCLPKSGWSIDPDTGWVANRALSMSQYLLATDAGIMQYGAASDYCVELGGHLLHLETNTEITMVTDYLLNGTGNGNSFWLGMTDKQSEGDWWWGTHSRVSTFNWMTGEPAGGPPNCAIVDAVNSYQWRNVNGIHTSHYALCEKE